MEQIAQTLDTALSGNLVIAFIVMTILNIIVAIAGILPSVFITIANLLLFGPIGGFAISLIGESCGAIISFLIYRKGFKTISREKIEKNEKLMKIIDSDGIEAMKLIFAFRLFPYMPSGLVTYCGAIGKVDVWHFTLASTLGKVPALIIEVIVSGAIIKVSSGLPINAIIAVVSLVLIFFVLKGILTREK